MTWTLIKEAEAQGACWGQGGAVQEMRLPWWQRESPGESLLDDNFHGSRKFCLFYKMTDPGTQSKVPGLMELTILVGSSHEDIKKKHIPGA